MKTLALLFSLCLLHFISQSQTYLMPTSGVHSITTSGGIIQDDGGNNNYSNNSNGTLTIYPQTPGSYVSLNFTSFALEFCCDWLKIYNGNSTSTPLIGTFSTLPSSKIFSSSNDGSITLAFHSNGSNKDIGFEAIINSISSTPKPDLTFQNYFLSSSLIRIGEITNLYYNVANIGSKKSLNFQVGIYLSQDTIIDQNDSLISGKNINNIDIGYNLDLANNFILSTNILQGEYYLITKIDHQNTITEENEYNNIIHTPVKILKPTTDLSILEINTSPNTSYYPGSSVNYQIKINNYGQTLANQVKYNVFLSSDINYDLNDSLLSSFNAGSIYPNSYLNNYNEITLPNSINVGEYYLLFLIDPLDSIFENNENNNIYTLPLSIKNTNNDINFFKINISKTNLLLGETVSGSCFITNQNMSITQIPTAFYLSQDSIIDVNDYFLTSSIYILSQDFINQKNYSINIPGSISSGFYYLIAYSDYTNSIIEINESNNIQIIKLNISLPDIDLQITDVNVSTTSVSTENPFRIKTIINNFGQNNVNSTNLDYYLSSDSILDINDILLKQSINFNVNSNSNNIYTDLLNIPSSVSIGNYYLLIDVDNQNTIFETNENNNLIFTPLSIVTPIYDLANITTNLNYSSTSGVYLSNFTYKIQNKGTTFIHDFSIGFYISSDTILDTNDIHIKNITSNFSLHANDSISSTESLLIPSNISLGNKFILSVVDFNNVLMENDEMNNYSHSPVQINSPIYDFQVNNIISPEYVLINNQYYCSAEIYNVGNSTASNVNYSTFLSIDTLLSSNDILLSTSIISNIFPGTYENVSTNLNFSNSLTSGIYYLFYYVDYNNQIVESIENNNFFYKKINVISSDDQYIVPKIGSNNITTCNALIQDNGGNNNYSNYSNGYLTIYPGYSGQKINLLFTEFELNNNSTDKLIVYNGTSTTDPILGQYTSNATPPVLSASNSAGAITIRFISGNYSTSTGFTILAYCDENLSTTDLKFSEVNPNIINTAPGYEININCELNYIGPLSTINSSFKWYLSQDTILNNSDLELGSLGNVVVYNKEYYPNANNSKSLTSTIPQNTSIETYYVLMVLDSANMISESNELNNVAWTVVNIQNPFIDLEVMNTTLQDNTMATENNVSVQIMVKNKGNTSSQTYQIGYYISTDTILSANDYLCPITTNNSNVYNQLPNLLITINSNITIPSSLPIGQYNLLYCADINNNIQETIEMNNIKWLPIEIIQDSFDIKALNIVANNILFTGSNSIYSKGINSGNKKFLPFKYAYYLSADTIFDNNDSLLQLNLYNGSTNPNINITLYSPIITISEDLPTGNQFIILVLDSDNQFNESNEINNIVWKQIEIRKITEDFIPILCQTSSSTLTKTNNYNISYNVYFATNINNSSKLINSGVFLSTDSLLSSDDILLENNTNTIYGNAINNNIYNVIQISNNISIGNYYMIFAVDSQNSENEINENNNTYCIKIKIIDNVRDIVPITVYSTNYYHTFNSSCQINSTILYQDQTTSNNLNVNYYISIDSIFSVNDILLTTSQIGYAYLQPNATILLSTSITIPNSLQHGEYYILIYVDKANIFNETNEQNNIIFHKIEVLKSMIDIDVKFEYVDTGEVLAGTNFYTSCELSNSQYTNTPPISIGYFLSNDNLYSIDDILLKTSNINSLAQNVIFYLSDNITIPTNTVYGEYFIIVVADFQNQILESNEDNNIGIWPINVNLNLSNLDFLTTNINSSYLNNGDPIILTSSIQNNGYLNSNIGELGYYLSTDLYFDDQDLLLGYSNINSLNVGASVNLSKTIVLPQNIITGTYYILFYADRNNSTIEVYEHDNIKVFHLEINGLNNVENLPETTINVFPNPANDLLTIEISDNLLNDNIKIEIIDNLGSIVYEKEGFLRRNEIINIDSFTTGVYALKIISNNGELHTKIIKE